MWVDIKPCNHHPCGSEMASHRRKQRIPRWNFIHNNTCCHMSAEAICVFPMNHTGIPILSQEETVNYPHRYYFWITIFGSAKQVWYPPTTSHTPVFTVLPRNYLLLNKTQGTDLNILGKFLMLNRTDSSSILILI